MGLMQRLYVTSHAYTSLTKVGISKDPVQRIKDLAREQGAELILYYESPLLSNAKQIEKTILEYFIDHRIKGEWINLPHWQIIEYVRKLEGSFDIIYHDCPFEHLKENVPLIREIDPGNFKVQNMQPCIGEDMIYIDVKAHYYLKYQQGLTEYVVCTMDLTTAQKLKQMLKGRLLPIIAESCIKESILPLTSSQ